MEDVMDRERVAAWRVAVVLAVMVALACGAAVWVIEKILDRPSGARLTAHPDDGRVTLRWEVSGDRDPEKEQWTWKYQQRDSDGPYGDWLPAGEAAKRSYVVGDLENGRDYLFRVRAENKHGGGAPSNEARATPAASVSRLLNVMNTTMLRIAVNLGSWETTPDGGYVVRVFHRENGVLAGPREGAGILVDEERRGRLETLAVALAACARGGAGLAVTVRGFASSAPFRDENGDELARSNALNLKVANRRAAEIANILASAAPSLTVSTVDWKSFGDMARARLRDREQPGQRIPDREFLNRSAEIIVPDLGGCAVPAGGGEG